MIQHFTIKDENYDAAIDLLNEEFFDKQFFINEIFWQIIERNPANDADLISRKY